MNLFDYGENAPTYIPLAERMRPKTLDEIIGHEELLGKNKVLRKLIESDQVSSMILQGPPATGKTSIASIISKHTNAEFITLNAVSLSISDLREMLNKAKDNLKFYRKRTIVFIDEIHAMKSNTQMALLQGVETGTIILIGATTESVTHDLIPPLISRCKVYALQPLTAKHIKTIIQKALQDSLQGLGSRRIAINEEALHYTADICNGDARSALCTIEAAAAAIQDGATIDLPTVQQVVQLRLNGISTTDYYDLTSAFIKSMRGSQTDAALYWLSRMLISGIDPLFIARRIVIHAAEDVGLANPQALQLAVAAKQAVEFIGMPEARIPLAEAVIYISESPKSNSAYKAIHLAMEVVKNNPSYPVPNQLKNSTGLYVNPIDSPSVKLKYLPQEISHKKFYSPQNTGIESKIFSKYNKGDEA